MVSLNKLRVLKANKTNIALGCVLKMLKRCVNLQTVKYSHCHNAVQAGKGEAELKKLEEDIHKEVIINSICLFANMDHKAECGAIQEPIEVANSSLQRLVVDSSFADLELYTLRLSSLHTIHLSHTRMLRDRHITQLVAHSPHLRHISLFSCASLCKPCFSFAHLLVLNLVSCDSMTDPIIQVSFSPSQT